MSPVLGWPTPGSSSSIAEAATPGNFRTSKSSLSIGRWRGSMTTSVSPAKPVRGRDRPATHIAPGPDPRKRGITRPLRPGIGKPLAERHPYGFPPPLTRGFARDRQWRFSTMVTPPTQGQNPRSQACGALRLDAAVPGRQHRKRSDQALCQTCRRGDLNSPPHHGI